MTRTRNSKKSQSSAIVVAKDEQIHVGVDVHKRTYHVAFWSGERGLVATWVQPANPELLVTKLRAFQEQIVEIVYEAGPTGFTLVRHLRSGDFNAQVVAPSKMLTLPGPEAKSDRLDCRKLAMFSEKRLLKFVRVPTKEEEADRQVMRLREQLVRKSRSIQQQIKSFLLQHGIDEPSGLAYWTQESVVELRGLELGEELRFCLDVMLDELEHAKAQVAKITRELGKLSRTQRHQAAMIASQSVPGVGLITAMTFRTEFLEPSRFTESGQVARMMGLAPHVSESGETRREGRLLKSGNSRLRTILVEAAWRWVANDKAAKERYRRLVANTGTSKKAVVAMARRLGILLWRLSVSGEQYRTAA